MTKAKSMQSDAYQINLNTPRLSYGSALHFTLQFLSTTMCRRFDCIKFLGGSPTNVVQCGQRVALCGRHRHVWFPSQINIWLAFERLIDVLTFVFALKKWTSTIGNCALVRYGTNWTMPQALSSGTAAILTPSISSLFYNRVIGVDFQNESWVSDTVLLWSVVSDFINRIINELPENLLVFLFSYLCIWKCS